MLVEEVTTEDGALEVTGRTPYQGPDVDGTTSILLAPGEPVPAVGDLVAVTIVDTVGVDLVGRRR